MAGELVRDLPEKLRVTAALLGRANQKDFCAAFRRVNPNTDFDLERSYNWVQGRALPRSARVYRDWVELVGAEGRSPFWLASCPLRCGGRPWRSAVVTACSPPRRDRRA